MRQQAFENLLNNGVKHTAMRQLAEHGRISPNDYEGFKRTFLQIHQNCIIENGEYQFIFSDGEEEITVKHSRKKQEDFSWEEIIRMVHKELFHGAIEQMSLF